MHSQRRGGPKRSPHQQSSGQDLWFRTGSRHHERLQLRGQRKREGTNNTNTVIDRQIKYSFSQIQMCVCVYRPVFQWSGWLLRVFSSVFIRFRVTSGLTASCCGRFFHWVRQKHRTLPFYYLASQFDPHMKIMVNLWFISWYFVTFFGLI